MGTRKALEPNVIPDAANIVATFYSATDDDTAAGMGWYAMAHAQAARISGGNVETGAGVIAALSPQIGWNENVRIAGKAFADDKASGQTTANCVKADRIMFGYGAPLDVLGGNKVRAFYAAIVDPNHPTAVVVDRHAFDIAVGRVTDNATRGVLSRVGVYELFADAYRQAADILSAQFGTTISPSAVQAVTWLAWRRMKGIVD